MTDTRYALVKLNSFALASNQRPELYVLHYSYFCIFFFQEKINANLPFSINAILNLSNYCTPLGVTAKQLTVTVHGRFVQHKRIG